MHIDAHEHDSSPITADVCIIGAGAAGITLAAALSRSGRRVLLVESGGFETSTQTDLLNAAQSPSIGGGYLMKSRVRVFGGTTSHWTGFCLPLADPTFEARPWVPHGGWPIDRDELHPYYERACVQIGVDPWPRRDPLPVPPPARPLELFEPGDWQTRVYQIERGAHFGEQFRDVLVESEDVVVLTHATCTELRTTDQRVDRVVLRTPERPEAIIEATARVFVLATGGIENARLLLASGGIGNEHDLVGRYYMDHPELVVGEAVLWPGWDLDLYFGGALGDDRRGFGALFPTPRLQRERTLLQAGIQLIPSRRWGRPDEAEIDRAVTAAGFWLDCARGATADGACLPAAMRTTLFIRSEQAPHPDNRVTLGRDRDVFNTPLPSLQWSMTELDRRSILHTVDALARSLYRGGLGRVRPFLTEQGLRDAPATFGLSATQEDRDHSREARLPLVLLWGHHMGTTRMASEPSRGVVDPQGRVHGCANLFVTGSSVFPTGGAANPTLTIVALALRLADTLDRALDPP